MLNTQKMRERLLQSGIARADQIRGCSAVEIESIEHEFKVKLPSAYKDFLAAFGHSAGGFWRDIDYTIDRLTWINQYVTELLAELETVKLSLPPQGFVFSSRHGEQFLYFVADGLSQNPPVYHYFLGDTEFVKASDTFWDAIESELEVLEHAYRNIPLGKFPWINHQ